ncbi:hypothetical protein AVEN_43796-1, partial [Araneus ventricosus]
KYLEILGDLPSILSLAPWLKIRREDIIITRTRMIITPALLHRFGLRNNPFCSMCNQENTIEHILLNFKKYLPHRRIFCLKLNLYLQIFSSYKVFLHRICSSKGHLQVFLRMLGDDSLCRYRSLTKQNFQLHLESSVCRQGRQICRHVTKMVAKVRSPSLAAAVIPYLTL